MLQQDGPQRKGLLADVADVLFRFQLLQILFGLVQFVFSIPARSSYLWNSYFHMSSAVRSLFRYEARGVSRVMQNTGRIPDAKYLKSDSARILNNVFRVRSDSLKKH
jgi:hypothetical protein